MLFDRIRLTISTQEDLRQKFLDDKEGASEKYGRDGVMRVDIQYYNLKISVYSNKIIVTGSLDKLRNGISGLLPTPITKEDFVGLARYLELSIDELLKAKVTLVEIGTTIINPTYYTPDGLVVEADTPVFVQAVTGLAGLKLYNEYSNGTSKTFANNNIRKAYRSAIIYDKAREVAEKYNVLHLPRLLRLELKLKNIKKSITEQGKPIATTLEDLTKRDLVAKIWQKVKPQLTPIVSRDFDPMALREYFSTSDRIMLEHLNKYGLAAYNDELKIEVQQGKISQNKKYRLLRDAKKILSVYDELLPKTNIEVCFTEHLDRVTHFLDNSLSEDIQADMIAQANDITRIFRQGAFYPQD
jgi:hypothetical protein